MKKKKSYLPLKLNDYYNGFIKNHIKSKGHLTVFLFALEAEKKFTKEEIELLRNKWLSENIEEKFNTDLTSEDFPVGNE